MMTEWVEERLYGALRDTDILYAGDKARSVIHGGVAESSKSLHGRLARAVLGGMLRVTNVMNAVCVLKHVRRTYDVECRH